MWFADINEYGVPEFRFSRHATFIYWAFSQLQRLETLGEINLNIRTKSITELNTLEKLKKMIKDKDPQIKNFIR